MACLFLFVMVVLNIVGVKAGNVYKDGASVICESKRDFVRSGGIPHEKDKKNILFMGSSQILSGIKPLLFDRLCGGAVHSYNLALPALSIGPYYFQLNDYLKTNPPPDNILLELRINLDGNVAMFDHYANQGISGWDEMASYFWNVKNKGVVLNYFFPIRMYKYRVLPYLRDAFLRPAALSRLRARNGDIVTRMREDRGYYFIREQALFPDLRLPEGYKVKNEKEMDDGARFDPFFDPYVKKFFDLAEERRIKVLLIQPAYRVGQFRQYETMPPQYSVLLQEYGNVTIAPNGWKGKFYENRYFADLVHLNPEGADHYTHEIYKEWAAPTAQESGRRPHPKKKEGNDN
ncbi:MAG: DUF1574 domain-containing protein [bacterium]|nr:DUF1574 domain-containing protein [bacterium]